MRASCRSLRSFDVSGADAIAYQNTFGAFLGASVGAGKITSDNDTNKAFYSKEYQAREILDGKVVIDNQYAKRLGDQLG